MNTEDKPTYKIVEGRYVVKNVSAMKWVVARHILTLFLRFLRYVVIYLASFFITFFIFENCVCAIPQNLFSNLEPTISLGAIFATFGSAIIAIYSLYCNEQLRRFHDTIDILQTSLLKTFTWNRWQFLKRYHIAKHSQHYVCYCLINPSITFQNGKRNLELFIPYSKEDFYELPIYVSYFSILKFQKNYLLGLHDLKQMSFQSELILLNCLSYLFRNIINYKKGRFFMATGCCFIFNSIVFALFYYVIWSIIKLPH